jgi:hypothetical protein
LAMSALHVSARFGLFQLSLSTSRTPDDRISAIRDDRIGLLLSS